MINTKKNSQISKVVQHYSNWLVLLDIILLTALIFINNINPQLYQFILYFDLFVVIILIAQFIYKFKNSTSKTKYLKDNWFDLVGMVPEIVLPGFATFLRYFRLIRILSLFQEKFSKFFQFFRKNTSRIRYHNLNIHFNISCIYILLFRAWNQSKCQQYR